MIPIFQNHIFEKQLQKRIDKNLQHERTPDKRVDRKLKSIQQLNSTRNTDNVQLLTPNHTNFNFKEASPFIVNINSHRAKQKRGEPKPNSVQTTTKKQPESTTETTNLNEVIIISDSDDEINDGTTNDHKLVKNLFDLTEKNIEKHLSTVAKKNRKDSLIRWRNKVNEFRERKSILPLNEEEFEAFLSENTTDTREVESSGQETVVTRVPIKSNSCRQQSETDDSFTTAIEVEKNLDDDVVATNRSETIFQTQEVYEHFDAENNIRFFENKLLAPNPVGSEKNTQIVHLNTSSESGACTDIIVPSDYDTDDLRKELKHFGEVPGPITKNTKRLYLKRLLRYKLRHPPQSTQNMKQKRSMYNQPKQI